jgi:hypothetical protein
MEELKLIISNYQDLFEFYKSNKVPGNQTQKGNNNITFSDEKEESESNNPVKRNLSENKQIFKLKLENKKLSSQLEETKKRNRTLEIRQKEIVSKMKNLRSIQIDSDLHQRWNDEVDDLEMIVEDAELFLDSIVNTQKNKEKLFFGDSKFKNLEKQKNENILSDQNMEIVLEPLFDKLQNIDLSGFDDEEMKQIDKKIQNMFNPIECILVFVNSFERCILKYKKMNKSLSIEKGNPYNVLIGRQFE